MLAERMKCLSGSRTSGMRNRARKLCSEGVHVVNFAAGELDQDTSPSIKEAAREAIDTGRTQYTDTLGIRELRERLAQKVSQKTGAAYTDDEVGFTAGAKQALFNSVFAVFGHEDEVIIPAPYWVTFPEQVRLAGATPVFLQTAHNDFQIDVDELARSITPRTRGILLNTPHNPTGIVYNAGVLEGIARLALQLNLICIFDECYDALVYAPAVHHNIVKLVPEMKARTILIGSFSKTYCIAGWRAGHIAAPQAIIKAVANLQSHIASNTCNLVQYAALAALEPANDAFVAENRRQLNAHRAAALQQIEKIPHLSCVAPAGAFYLFPDVSGLLNKSFKGQRVENVDQLAEMLLEYAHIAVVSGAAFGSDRHIRISYAIPNEEIAAGLTRLEQFVKLLA
ncbi:MAG: pyridoxal phosphate-dependent aminotransferase [Planctomycetes bacterium]|nr:pyridoxal phosphate-dependent aminotransferase [Planctomycetota bacterium]